jgi:selenocysteine-specific elongation factor
MSYKTFHDLILGTAGHIDHGKTSLIKALTGIDTDRLPEEKKRGITIELGYSHIELPPFRLGIVDVPGHEKFVRQMLAGATGMNLAMLIVAADDSIKPQTYEHLDILRLLELSSGVIVITKSDLVEPDWLDLVELEVRQLVEGTFLADVPIIRTSAKTGAGLSELKTALFSECEKLVQHKSAQLDAETKAPFRMAIDRAFSIAGHGTVVTGSVLSGSVAVGDQIEILPAQLVARIRGLQNHDSPIESIHAGQRAAINLAGVGLQDVERGHELASPGFLQPAKRVLVRLQVLERTSKPLEHRSMVRFHIGTAEMMAQVNLLNQAILNPGESGLAQIRLSEPAVATWGQPFVIRRPSPMESIGGGTIIHPNPVFLRSLAEYEKKGLADLHENDEIKRASAAAYFCEHPSFQARDLLRLASIRDFQTVFERLKLLGELREIRLTASQTVFAHRLTVDAIAGRALTALEKLHQKHPLRFAHPRQELANQFSYLPNEQWLNLAIDQLKERKLVNANVHSIALVNAGPQLSKGQKQLMEQLILQFKTTGLSAPSVSELKAAAIKNKDAILELLELAAENGSLTKISAELFLHSDCVADIKERLVSALPDGTAMTASEIRQALGTTRKYAIPLLEYFDSIGLTRRDGDLRTLVPDASDG